MSNQSLEELQKSIESQIRGHRMVHSRFEFLDCDASLLLEAFEHIKKTVTLCAAGIEDPKKHRAEAYLLMILQNAYHHGYTPRKSKDDWRKGAGERVNVWADWLTPDRLKRWNTLRVLDKLPYGRAGESSGDPLTHEQGSRLLAELARSQELGNLEASRMLQKIKEGIAE